MHGMHLLRAALGTLAVGSLLLGAIRPTHAASTGYLALGGSFVGSPVTVAQPARLDTFVVGADHTLYHKALTPAGWLSGGGCPFGQRGSPNLGFDCLGGSVLGRPAAIAGPGGRIDVFVVGTDHALYHKWFDGTRWLPTQTGFEYLGGYVLGNPAVVSSGTNILDVFVIGADHALYHKWYDGYPRVQAWFPSKLEFEGLGGYSLSDPAPISWGNGRIDVFVVGTDQALYHKWTNNAGGSYGVSWQPSQGGYENLGGIIVGQPVVDSQGAGMIDVFIVGTDQALYHKWWVSDGCINGSCTDQGAWLPSTHSFENLGGPVVGTPQAVSVLGYNSGLYVVAEGTDRAVIDKYSVGTTWQPGVTSYENLGGYAAGEVSAATGYYTHTLDLFVIGADGGLYYKFKFSGAWYSQP